MAKLREWLEEEGFDYETGTIIAHMCTDNSYSPGWGDGDEAFKFTFKGNKCPDNEINVLLDVEFDDGYGAPECPRFIAEDKDKLYFPWQYDGATGLEVVYKDISKYMDVSNPTPYPGG